MTVANLAGEAIVWVVWFAAALALIGSGFAVVSFSNPFYSALALILNLGSLAVLYLLLSAQFVAAAQVLVYAGAVMVMFLFVIAYLGGRADAPWAGGRSLVRAAAVIASSAILVEIVVVIASAANKSLATAAQITSAFGSPSGIGRLFLGNYLIAFEVTSIILLVGAVGGVILGAGARREEAERRAVSAPERPAAPEPVALPTAGRPDLAEPAPAEPRGRRQETA